MNRALLLILVPLFLVAGGCAAPARVKTIDRLDTVGDNPRIVLMPPDIRYYLISAGGMAEPHAEWTSAARENFATATAEFAESIGTDLTILDDSNLSPTEIEYEQLHSAVGSTILANYFGYLTLPAKEGRFDWTLGPGVARIGEQHDADYALFVYYRDRQATGGRVAFALLAAAAGAYADMGSENGFASLVDLKTGDIVWFNVVTAGSGELRDKDGAARAVAQLFRDIPANR